MFSLVSVDHFVLAQVVIRELFAAGVETARLVCQRLAVDHLVFELDVGLLFFSLVGSESLTT